MKGSLSSLGPLLSRHVKPVLLAGKRLQVVEGSRFGLATGFRHGRGLTLNVGTELVLSLGKYPRHEVFLGRHGHLSLPHALLRELGASLGPSRCIVGLFVLDFQVEALDEADSSRRVSEAYGYLGWVTAVDRGDVFISQHFGKQAYVGGWDALEKSTKQRNFSIVLYLGGSDCVENRA